MSNYSKAEPLYIQALEVQKKVLGEEHPDYATSLSNLASLYADMSNYTKAKSLFIQALKIQKKVLGEEHPDYALSVNNLAKLYSDLGNYIEAEPLYIKALAIKKKSLGEEHPDFALSINNLASLYGKMGNYSKAEDLLIQALSIRKNALGEDNLDYAISLNNLTLFYTNMGIYEKAEPLQIKALSIQRRVLGEEHPDYAISLNNLAVLYKNMGLYLKAEPLQIKALSIQRKVLGEEHPDYAISLNNLAALYREMSNYSKAEPLYIQALEVQKKVLGEEHPDYATSLFNFGVLYADVSNYPKAEPLFIQALAIQKKVLGEEHPDYAVSLNNLALLYNDMGRIDKAKPLYSKALSIRKKYWQNNFSFLNRQELTQFVENNLPNQEIPLSFLSRNINNEIKNQLADFNLFIKNAMLFNNQLLDEIANKSKNPIVAVSWQQFIGLRLNISRLLQLPLNQQLHLRELQNQSDSIEKELMRNLPEFQQMVINNNLNWKDVQNKLKANEATIDFVSFHYSNKQLTNTIKYAAFISRPSWDGPQFINLFNEEQLASLFDSSNTSYSINKLYCNYNGIGDSSCTSELYKLIWQPMDSLLSGVKKVYVSPSGLLHRVSFSAIPIPEGGRLIDRYSLEMLANIRTLAEIHKEESDIPISFTLIGGVDYDAEPTVFNPQKNKLIKDTLFSSLRSLHRGRWSFLAGTEDEIMDIKKIIAPLNLSLDLITSSNASEEVIKMIGKPNRPVPSVIHIATHGFAFTKPKAISQPIKFQWQEERGALFRNSEDPLTRAGLVMAGGNRIWTTGFPFLNREDGILTASEVSELNLKGCLLATLSACETGLGEIKGGEGIFGLQRAFKMAGVHYLIVSLWKVPDSQTKEFMALFYSAWLIQKLTIREAFRKTQIMMSKKYSPYQWGAFILVE
jgi:CHAT domain-containing protein/tetratricopeptide (TPR) repeat protein